MKKPEKKDCSECQYISMTEEVQNLHGEKTTPHICLLLDQRIKHMDFHPILPPLSDCPVNQAYMDYEKFLPSVDEMATYLYENQPECLTAIAKERRAEACYDIARTLAKRIGK